LNKLVEKAIRYRKDISPYLVHLTRDDNNQSAEDKLISILNDGEVRAFNYECLFRHQIDEIADDKIRDFFRVASFTETPLHELHRMVNEELNEYRQKKFRPYGVAFRKELVALNGGEPVIYVYNKNHESWWKEQFNRCIESGSIDKNSVFHLVNKVDKKNDWHWEREWKIRGGFKFNHDQISYIILPDLNREQIVAFRQKIKSENINFFCIPSGTTYHFCIDRGYGVQCNPETGEHDVYYSETKLVFRNDSDGGTWISQDGGVTWEYHPPAPEIVGF
jgi:hypothetical protein